jgi:C1A family cysteine protease
MARAAAHNARNASWTMGATPFADLSAEEFAARVARGGVRRERAARPSRLRPMSPPAPPPASVDWVAKGAVSPVGDEGQCGACWAWAAAGAIEGAGFVAAGGGAPLVEASIQELLDCASGNQGCNGGMADLAFQWAVSNKGVASADAYPYTGQGGACRATSVPNSLAVSGFKDVPPNSELALEAAIAQQPVAVVVEADQSVFQLYTGGVMDSACGANVDHAMLAVGYGTDGGKTFYTLKNEWSAAWGEKGYIRIGRGAKFNPAGQCGVQVAPSIVEA